MSRTAVAAVIAGGAALGLAVALPLAVSNGSSIPENPSASQASGGGSSSNSYLSTPDYAGYEREVTRLDSFYSSYPSSEVSIAVRNMADASCNSLHTSPSASYYDLGSLSATYTAGTVSVYDSVETVRLAAEYVCPSEKR